MKNTIITAALLSIFTLGAMAQKNVDKDPNWKVGETKTFQENKIKRLEGENNGTVITNITYQTLKQLVEGVNNGKSKGDAKKNQIKSFKQYAPGGMVVFYVNRATAAEANLKNISLTIKDASGKEIYKRQYKEKAPKTNKDGGFYMTTNLQVKYKLEGTFTVELFDGKTTYIFEVVAK